MEGQGAEALAEGDQAMAHQGEWPGVAIGECEYGHKTERVLEREI